ncbi:transglutaminase-like cysteine peptidase [Pelagibacterium lentulum]|uniref:Transglutaminase n=1 Tax=Pelagibacterium lentulum TaxID=2029865 RepID=A0A916RMQ8_9HYPH|nr:transglutaminase-like cysteine peptidase [Pelagibacterium lentulum]GGA60955.1 hypothetical protein GCM10011499_34040 [Pelagibacterium lentulum]
MKTKNILISGLLAIVASTGLASGAAATESYYGHPAFASVSGQTSIPVGHAEFCTRRPAECSPTLGAIDHVKLTDTLWDELQLVNNHYNISITPVSDMDLYGVPEFWTYPVNGYGDCEDIALAKRAALIERGWHPSTLLMTVVRQANGEGHAVLMVRTDRGDLILDNQDALIKVWNDTPYTFLKRQSQAHAGQWVDIIDNQGGSVTATAGY